MADLALEIVAGVGSQWRKTLIGPHTDRSLRCVSETDAARLVAAGLAESRYEEVYPGYERRCLFLTEAGRSEQAPGHGSTTGRSSTGGT